MHLVQSRKTSSAMLTTLCPPVIQLFFQMEATLMMHQLPRAIHTFATNHMQTFRILTKTCRSGCHLPPPHTLLGFILPAHTAWTKEVSVWLLRHIYCRRRRRRPNTPRNNGMVNSYNPVQLSAWHANMQYIVS